MPNKKIIINDMPHETRVALLEEGEIAELFIERQGSSDSSGNVYKGRVQRVLPGMQAAFVDIGRERASFLHASDLVTLDASGVEARGAQRDAKQKDGGD